MEKTETVPNISEFLVGAKTAVYDEKERGDRYLVSFEIKLVRRYLVRAKSKGMATSLGRNRLNRTIKNMKAKSKPSRRLGGMGMMLVKQVDLIQTRAV